MINDTILLKIINDIKYIPAEFGYDFDCDNPDNIYDILENQISLNKEDDYTIGCGVSKCAIVPKNADWVIKIPFNGKYEDAFDEDGEYLDEKYWIPYCYANDINSDAEEWDYCENELLKYKKAVNAGFGKFFVETQYYGEINCYPIYIQKKAYPLSCIERKTSISDNSRKQYEENKLLFGYFNKDWILSSIEYYGLEETLRFFNYIQDDMKIVDLHSGNLGYTEDGHPVLIDWADWRD